MSRAATPTGPTYPIESVENALKLIVAFKERAAITVADAASELGVARSTAHRLLAMLAAHGFVRQSKRRGAYTLGPTIFDLGARSVAALDIRAFARPFVERLSREINETASFGVRFDDRIVFVEAFQSRESLRVSTQPGQQFSAHGSAIGRASLALLTDTDVKALYPSETLPISDTQLPEPFPTRTKLLKDLALIRSRGYAINYDLPVLGVCAVAAAVCDGRGDPHGAIALSAPTSRIRRTDIPAVANAVMRTARDLSLSLP